MAELHGRKRMTEAALAANRRNAQKAGRPPGITAPEKIGLRDRIRAREEEMVTHLFHLAFHAQSEQSQVASLRKLFDRGWGRPPQPMTGQDGIGPVVLQVSTGVATPEQWGDWDEPLPLAAPETKDPTPK